MKINKIHNLVHSFRLLFLILVFILSSCEEKAKKGSQQIKNFKKSQLVTTVTGYDTQIREIENCEIKYDMESYFNGFLEEPNYRLLSVENFDYDDYYVPIGSKYIIIVHGDLKIPEEKKLHKTWKNLYYSGYFASDEDGGSGEIDTWTGEVGASAQSVFAKIPLAPLALTGTGNVEETYENFMYYHIGDLSHLDEKEKARVKKKADAIYKSIDREIFFLEKIEFEDLSIFEDQIIDWISLQQAGRENSDLKNCLKVTDKLGIFTDEFFETGKLNEEKIYENLFRAVF